MSVLTRLLLAICAVALVGPASLRAQADEWTVYASVVDRNGAPVMGLTANDFGVRENGVAREILRAAPASDSLRVAVLVDNSQEMRSDVIDLRRDGVSPTDPAAQEVELTLAAGTQMTGGRREDLLTSMAMTARFQSLATELNHQYQVVYARPRMLIPPKTIEVGVRRHDAIVRAPRVL